MHPPGTARAIRRSLDIYHGDKAHGARLDALYRTFLNPGDLVFDIGAHVGDRIASFRRLEAKVVAIEPQPSVMRALRLLFGRDKAVTLLPQAVAAQPGSVKLFINSRNPTVSTALEEFIEKAQGAPGWEGQQWDAVHEVETLTLDLLIERYGLPAFVKIDVEGLEDQVLAGLTHPLPALSFEFTTIARDCAFRALARLEALGPFSYNLSLGETHAFLERDWVDARSLRQKLEDLPMEANSGDVYARSEP